MRKQAAGFRNLVGIIAALAIVGGCTVPEVGPAFRKPDGGKLAAVVMSITRHGVQEFTMLLEVVGDGHDYRNIIDVADYSKLDWKPPEGYAPIPKNRPAGRLVVFQLPPGRYKITRWNGESDVFGDDDSGYGVFSKPISIRFNAPPGQVTYVGNLHFAFTEKMNGYIYNGKYRIETRATEERDLALMKRKFPEISLTDLRRAPFRSDEAGKELEFYVMNHYGGEGSMP